jgi:hypothetical protein
LRLHLALSGRVKDIGLMGSVIFPRVLYAPFQAVYQRVSSPAYARGSKCDSDKKREQRYHVILTVEVHNCRLYVMMIPSVGRSKEKAVLVPTKPILENTEGEDKQMFR